MEVLTYSCDAVAKTYSAIEYLRYIPFAGQSHSRTGFLVVTIFSLFRHAGPRADEAVDRLYNNILTFPSSVGCQSGMLWLQDLDSDHGLKIEFLGSLPVGNVGSAGQYLRFSVHRQL